ncbi:hypothetical protein Aduo_012490 [Ancylostoma duodenale]
MPDHETIKYKLNFGTNLSVTIETESLEKEIQSWMNDYEQMQKFWHSATTASSAFVQYDDPVEPLSAVIKSFYDIIANDNQHSSTVVQKKQMVLLTDYMPVNVTIAMNTITSANEQKLALVHELNVTDFHKSINFPVYSAGDGIIMTEAMQRFQQPLDFDFPEEIYQGKPIAIDRLFMTEFDASTVIEIVENAVFGDLCNLPSNKMYRNFVPVLFAHGGVVRNMTIPFIGDRTMVFAKHCIEFMEVKMRASSEHSCDPAVVDIIDQFAASLRTNKSFVSLVINNSSCIESALDRLNISSVHGKIRLVSKQNLEDIYDNLTLPLLSSGFINATRDQQIVFNSPFYLTNYSTSCRSEVPFVSLVPSSPFHKLKRLYIALDDMVWISACATISVTVFGFLIYRHVKRQHKKQMEILTEMMLQPKLYKAAKECPKVARLPWEIKSDHVHIDMEFLLGEGTISNVYLGKLKGKAPILQWIGRVEMKQYQDCPVAVRVPRHFDEPEEDQLFREISSMRRLRHHDHIALFLGWTNKNDLVCSLLELTHMNLLKYLGQINETVLSSADGQSASYIPFHMLFKIIWEICDGISYIHSRNLIHRDIAARNVLLTTGLRAKISGFGFCSDPDDPKFLGNSLALRYLPVRWLAPECFQGKFSSKSDTWSFGVLLYEIFTLGEVPYEDLQKPEEIVECVRHSRIPAHPKHASRKTYNIMQQCFHRYPERRPAFTHLMDVFQSEMEALFINVAFEGDEDN